MIINSRADLDALRGTPDWPVALRLLAGTTIGWRKSAAQDQTLAWERVEDTAALDRLGMTTAELQAELDATGIIIDPPQAPPVVEVPAEQLAAPSFRARDLLALLTDNDLVAIESAIATNTALRRLWISLLGQGEAPIIATSDRFVAGWAGLSAALGQARSDEIAAALGIMPPAS